MRTSAQVPGAKRHLVLTAQNDTITSNALAHTLTAYTLSGDGIAYVHALTSWEGNNPHTVTVCRPVQGLTAPSIWFV